MKEYKITVAGVEQTVQLSDEDAKARGLSSGDETGRQIDGPATSNEGEPETKQAAAPANKAKASDNK